VYPHAPIGNCKRRRNGALVPESLRIEMNKMNKEWHNANPMPPNATRDERISWHTAHTKACQCRPIPASLREEVQHYLTARADPRSELQCR
jgi:hypothetical protein